MAKTTKTEKESSIEVIILAAGLGTRMKSPLPKVLHEVCGSSMLSLLMQSLARSGKKVSRFNVVVGYERQTVIDHVKKFSTTLGVPVIFSVQAEQKGTAHAVQCALDESLKTGIDADIIAVFNGDLPLFTPEAFNDFISAHHVAKSSATMGTTQLADATGYGRVIRKGGKFVGNVEHKDATPAQKKIREINGGVYLFEKETLITALKGVSTKNVQKEFYLPDVFTVAAKKKKKIFAHKFADSALMLGANNMKELAEAQKLLYARTAEKWMIEGVFIHDPSVTYIGPEVQLNREVVIAPFTTISGRSQIASGVKIGSFCNLKSVKIAEKCTIKDGVVADGSVIGAESSVGPFVQFRAGTVIGSHVKVGNFVEVKESSLGDHTAASHLSYIGDAEVGSNVNIGCGFVTCNFDGTVREGRRKHRSKIGNNVFIGSDSQVVAPITIADGTFIASGSTVTDSVNEDDSLVIARTKQVTKLGYAKKYKK